MSVRFLGRRVYLALAVVLGSARHAGQNPAAARLAGALEVPVRTLQRWRQWWAQQFPLTPLWQAACARFMPPVAIDRLPASLLERFAGNAEEVLMRLLVTGLTRTAKSWACFAAEAGLDEWKIYFCYRPSADTDATENPHL